jgi:hypothetical protein
VEVLEDEDPMIGGFMSPVPVPVAAEPGRRGAD